MLNLCWFKHNKVFECFSYFWEVFCFYKNWKISKTVLPCFDDLVAGQTSRMSQSSSRRSVLETCSRVEGPVARGTQRFSQLSSQLPREKHLANFSKLLAWSVLAGETGDFLATYLSREKRVIGKSWSIFKRCSVFPWTFYDYSLSLSTETNPNTPCHCLQTPFLIHFFSNLQEKGMGLLFLTSYFMFWVLSSCFMSCHFDLRYTMFEHVFFLWLLGLVVYGWLFMLLISFAIII